MVIIIRNWETNCIVLKTAQVLFYKKTPITILILENNTIPCTILVLVMLLIMIYSSLLLLTFALDMGRVP